MAPEEKQVQRWQTVQDGVDKLWLEQAPVTTPGKDEVLVEIRAVSLNYRDTEVVNGLYKHHKSLQDKKPDPLTPCSDMCGVVTAVGPDLTVPWKVGDRVLSTFTQSHLSGQIKEEHMATGMGFPLDGVLQTQRVFPSTGLVKAPDSLSDEEASCLPIAAVTAWMALFWQEPLREFPDLSGKVVVVQGTGGVSISGMQIAKAAGATTIVTSSSDDKLQKAKALGADHLINYRTTPEWQDEVMKLTAGRGADVIFECGGADTLHRSLQCVAFGGLVSCIGYLSGKQDKSVEGRPHFNLLALSRNVTVKGLINGPRDRFEDVVAFYDKHGIKPVVDRVFGFEEGRAALEYLMSGGHFGKVVVKISG
ncbi:hypothetical protein MGG_16926 [Pyricularia oryzae 70-15]|uniref:Enoyl reductase (ER) domain-containing protein n=3 Tax=Pyricularia oryzae TaxID=318829 RepID=G4N106_PYRO7|nr:uncharacterized protein MGG_16926 [Pyricularia oryzae 70-15]EHA53182.1 hypothetical protein MGG_16926 [Pyricularia oryzae 70-15]ELQ44997.1 alcohol dehydrogenase [Pyricularia oryzae Y34]KAI7911411.1 hypothetical protein M9X92_010539 [Pyricularia oryzae]KAI7912277.1 hypothetical protein M0657_010518 [Pyricularia oryzae]